MRLLSSVWNRMPGLRKRQPCAKPAPRRLGLALEHLEDRCVPATLTEFAPLPTLNAAPTGITTANDGSLWFTERSANKIARLTTAGVLTEYAIPTASSAPEQITASPDGYVWFTERYGRKIGRISQNGGAISEFALPGYGEFATAITTRSDGAVWFAANQQPNTARIGRISSTGAITELATAATSTYITGIVGGPDGNLWVTRVSSQWGDGVSKVSTAGWGSFTNYRIPTAYSSPQSITAGSDNNLWFTEKSANKIGRITTAGVMTEFSIGAGSGPQQIRSGPDGALWFTEQTGNKIGRMTVTGALTEDAVPTAASQPFGITVGRDGNIYFTEQAGNKVGKATLAPSPGTPMFSLAPPAAASPSGDSLSDDDGPWAEVVVNDTDVTLPSDEDSDAGDDTLGQALQTEGTASQDDSMMWNKLDNRVLDDAFAQSVK